MQQQNTYNQPPMGQGMPPQMGMPRQGALRPRGWRERWMSRFGMSAQMPRAKELTIPNWITGKSIVFFFVALFACWAAFGYIPEVNLWLLAAISVALFFFGGAAMAKSWIRIKEKALLKNVFTVGFVVRLAFVGYMFFSFNPNRYGATYGDGADVVWYMPFGEAIAQWIRDGFNIPFGELKESWQASIDDIGYPIWLGIVYFLTGSESDVLIPFILKSLMGAYCAILIYRVSKRHFGEGTARIAAIFIALNPNMIYWCGNMMKETEMVFLVCLAVELLDNAMTSNKRMTIRHMLPGLLVGFYLFFFRAALGMVVFLAVFAHIVMASNRVMGWGKKIIAGVLVALTLFVGAGDSLRSRVDNVVEAAQSATSGGQEADANRRANRVDEGGHKQSFAKYAGAAVFAPLIFTIPFPTFNEANVAQVVQVQLSGGAYIKNIFSFFVILVLIMLLLSGDWRRHVFIIAYTVGYLMCLVLSTFAQSGRFHMPVWPMLMLFAAYGIQLAKTNPKIRKWFPIVLVIEVVICLGWNWFKLKGRGMI